jgi:hypothetical protein
MQYYRDDCDGRKRSRNDVRHTTSTNHTTDQSSQAVFVKLRDSMAQVRIDLVGQHYLTTILDYSDCFRSEDQERRHAQPSIIQ